MKKKSVIDISKIGEAAAVANTLRTILFSGEAKALDTIAGHSNIRGDDLLYLASCVSSQLDAMYKAVSEMELC